MDWNRNGGTNSMTFKTPTITAIIIACDGYNTLCKTVESVIDVVDEVIILNTGTLEWVKTVPIQSEKKINIVTYKWENDFSKARNIAINHASKDICFFIDADEYLITESQKNFRRVMNEVFSHDEKSLYAPLIDNLNGIILRNNVRIFKKRGTLKYKGAVHEYLNSNDSKIVHLPDIILEHSGYLDEEMNGIKKTRNLSLLRKELSVDPYNLRWNFFLLRYIDKDSPERMKIMRIFSKLPYPPESEVYCFNVKTQIIIYLLESGKFEKAFNQATELYQFYKDKNSARLYFISHYLNSKHLFHSSLNTLNELKSKIDELSDDIYLNNKISNYEFNHVINDFNKDYKFITKQS